jgi:hypothetical protein
MHGTYPSYVSYQTGLRTPIGPATSPTRRRSPGPRAASTSSPGAPAGWTCSPPTPPATAWSSATSTLRDYPVNRILSSSALRCLQTVEPLAQRRDLPVETTETLAVHADPAALLALLSDPAAAETVLCGHGELIGVVLKRLLAPSPNGDSPTRPKGSTWVLETDGGRLLRSRFLPPLRLQGTEAGYY